MKDTSRTHLREGQYEPALIENKWAQYWAEHETFKVDNVLPEGYSKFYVLDMFPYPSGTGLHVGHPRGYVASDIVARFMRMQGFQVLHPMGWDSFGLPTERQSEKEQLPPQEITSRNIAVFRRQLKLLGLSFDWTREICTSDPAYYKWTQWIFLKLYERGLAYLAEVPVNWCPALSTVLANEEVKDGVYIETGDPVERRLMSQWMLRITAYAQRLLDDLELLDWPERLKEMQRNWIGRSEGASISFNVHAADSSFCVFSTRPETLFGCTFCILAPEHPLARTLSVGDRSRSVHNYLEYALARPDRERLVDAEKTGVFTGSYAVNPINGDLVPIWVADYVIGTYGNGAVFGCPAHDERDFQFARTFDLPIREVISGGSTSVQAYVGAGQMINSGFLNGKDDENARRIIIEWLDAHCCGKFEVRFALRDWLFSRQRYWGEPIPMLTVDDGTEAAVPEEYLPILLPPSLPARTANDKQPTPLARATDWVKTTDPRSGLPAVRETNTMPQWAGSSWYFLRFIDPQNCDRPWDPGAERTWMPVDLYVGGAEHATLHLLYARFWHKFLFDLGYVSTPEPFRRLFNQGMVHSRSFRDDRGRYYYQNEVLEQNGRWFAKDTGVSLISQVEKMSKSRCNGIPPEEVISEYGADSLRIYEVFMGPMDESVLWQSDGLVGVRRFLDRVWRLFAASLDAEVHFEAKLHAPLERLLQQTISKVTEDIRTLHLNTAVSQLMIFANEATKLRSIPLGLLRPYALLLSPFAPHLAEELWERMGCEVSIAFAQWPKVDLDKCKDESVWIVVQVNSKAKLRVHVSMGADEEEVLQEALRDPRFKTYLEHKQIVRKVFVADRLLNIVIN